MTLPGVPAPRLPVPLRELWPDGCSTPLLSSSDHWAPWPAHPCRWWGVNGKASIILVSSAWLLRGMVFIFKLSVFLISYVPPIEGCIRRPSIFYEGVALAAGKPCCTLALARVEGRLDRRLGLASFGNIETELFGSPNFRKSTGCGSKYQITCSMLGQDLP